MRRDIPHVPSSIDYPSYAIAPSLVCCSKEYRRPSFYGSADHRIHISHIYVDNDRRTSIRLRSAAFQFRIFAVNHKHGVAHLQGRVHHRSIFTGSTGQLLCVEGASAKLDFRCSVHTDQHRDDESGTHGERPFCLTPKLSGAPQQYYGQSIQRASA